MKITLGLAVSLALLAAAGTNSHASQPCGPRAKMIEALNKQFKENRAAIALVSGRQAVIELFISPQGSWTLSLTDTRGMTCIVGAGEDWQSTPKTLAGLES